MLNTAPSLSVEAVLNVLSLSKEATAIYTGSDLHIQFVNDGMLSIWGKDRSIIGKTLEEAIPRISNNPYIKLLRDVWRTGEIYIATNTPAELMVDNQLQTFYFDFTYRAIKSADGEVYCILHTAKDVTESLKQRKNLEEKERLERNLNEELAAINTELIAANDEMASINEELNATNEELSESMAMLASSQERLRSIMEQAPIGMSILTGPDMIVELANDVILNIWGRKAGEVIGLPHAIARPELYGQPVVQWLEGVYQSGQAKVNNEFKVMLYDNGGLRPAYVNSIYQPFKNLKGEVTGILIILEEITDSVKARQEAERTQEMFNLAIEAAELGTFYYNPNTNLFSGNNQLKVWFGLQPQDDLDLSVATNVIDEADRQRVIEAISNSLQFESGGNYDAEYTILNPHSLVPRIVRAKGKVTFDQFKQAVSLNGTLQDVTERRRNEQRKNDFIGMVSHELKTPLTSIKAYLQMLQSKAKKVDDTLTYTALEKVLTQVRKMTGMINGFLNVSRLESGQIHIDLQLFDLATLLKEVEDESAATVTSHRVVFEPVMTTMVKADRDKIGQVINNFISNAVKYSPYGSTIHVSCVTRQGLATVCVRDEGMGIKPEDQGKLFNRYYRVEGEHMTAISGFGIGLYLCSEIIQRHGGKIWLNSEFGQGAAFYFGIPAEGNS